jgi:hypothetical protein
VAAALHWRWHDGCAKRFAGHEPVQLDATFTGAPAAVDFVTGPAAPTQDEVA